MKKTLLFLILSILAFSVPVFAEDEAATPASASLCNEDRSIEEVEGDAPQGETQSTQGQEADQN